MTALNVNVTVSAQLGFQAVLLRVRPNLGADVVLEALGNPLARFWFFSSAVGPVQNNNRVHVLATRKGHRRTTAQHHPTSISSYELRGSNET